ncbi:hypothetical protein [Paraburkholderia hospita]|jgi:hypothetical protein|uniref:hypothetical protein n=1 Tax=Paraburkholderia hospita TaxID=169430 RepID=UPI001FC8FF97|nr:hypothetical protein [Paraburkholderia hospita]
MRKGMCAIEAATTTRAAFPVCSFSLAPWTRFCGRSFLESMMKLFVRTLVIATALAVPALSQAQESSPPVQSQQSNASESGYGGSLTGKDQAGSQKKAGGFWHRGGGSTSGDNCTGPISYCSIFFGS